MTEDVEALCDRVVVRDHGQITFDTPAGTRSLATGHVGSTPTRISVRWCRGAPVRAIIE